jgi:hypothetical protein
MVDPGRIDASTWAGLGVLGLVVFVLGVAIPSLPAADHLPERAIVAVVVAIAGGCVAALGFGWSYDYRRGAPRPARPPKPDPDGPTDRSVRPVPSFEIYDPNAPEGPTPPGR